ncbi:hypothetical protein [Streptomyces colonosanans]|uniref:hypothetical protein n=1 Tax=Streptomyces colonosanans TaxID=1428652 RepID=UPI0015A6FFAB|nr:hypothetical protein [Streptomyces colonosanans]
MAEAQVADEGVVAVLGAVGAAQDIAETAFIATLPPRVNRRQVTIVPTGQFG